MHSRIAHAVVDAGWSRRGLRLGWCGCLRAWRVRLSWCCRTWRGRRSSDGEDELTVIRVAIVTRHVVPQDCVGAGPIVTHRHTGVLPVLEIEFGRRGSHLRPMRASDGDADVRQLLAESDLHGAGRGW